MLSVRNVGFSNVSASKTMTAVPKRSYCPTLETKQYLESRSGKVQVHNSHPVMKRENCRNVGCQSCLSSSTLERVNGYYLSHFYPSSTDPLPIGRIPGSQSVPLLI